MKEKTHAWDAAEQLELDTPLGNRCLSLRGDCQRRTRHCSPRREATSNRATEKASGSARARRMAKG